MATWAKSRETGQFMKHLLMIGRGALTVIVLSEYLDLWDLLSEVRLQPSIEDTHIWQFVTTGKYSAKSGCEVMFIGAIHFKTWERIWKS